MAETDTRTEEGGTEPGSKREREEARAKVRCAQRKKGLLIVHTGLGKGKTTAALGLFLRAWGRGMKVGGIQFFKHEKARFGEIRAAARMGIDLIPMGDGFTWTSRDLDETQARALHGWEVAKEKIAHGGYDLFLLDEFTYVMHYGWIDAGEAVDWLRQNKPTDLHLIITGRHAPTALVDQADLVTEMQLVKHPFRDQGIRAQPGIEF
jgi:cob(I)alamin adenosyltransferase